MRENGTKRVAVLTSGGDAPGMNACIRAFVRTAIICGFEVLGVRRGYSGLIGEDLVPMDVRSVGNIVQRGGTILRTSRCKDFLTEEGRAKAAEVLKKNGIGGLMVIGGDGSFRGAHQLFLEHTVGIVGCPGTIDNDLYGTDFTIGYDTAINTALESIDRLRDTAASHDRIFIVEVMGRHSGFIALDVAISGGAEAALIPETRHSLEELSQTILEGRRRGKTSSIIVVSEGDEEGGAFAIADRFQSISGLECKVAVLGHIQRGGSPTARDRILATKLGAGAAQAIARGVQDCMVGEVGDRVVYTPFVDTWEKKKAVDMGLYELIGVLSQ